MSSETKKKTHVCLCLGSSCYSRGNRDNLELIQNLIEEGADAYISIEGCHCQGNCGNGPNVTINGEQISGMSPELFETYIKDILNVEVTE